MGESIPSERPSIAIKRISNILFGGLLLFFVLEYFRLGRYIPIIDVAKLNTIIPVGVFVLTFISRNGPSHRVILNASNSRWLAFFLLLFPIQVFTADVTLYVFNVFKAIVGYLFIYFIIVKQVTNVTRIKVVFSAMVFIHVVLIFLTPDVVLRPETRNYIDGGPFLGDGNDFAWSACIVLPMALFLVQTSERKWEKLLFLGTFAILVIAIVGTQSRGGSIALGASILYLVIRGRKKALGLIMLGALVMVVMFFAPRAYFDRMKTINDYETDGSAQGRIMAWKSAVRMAMDHPLIGVGAGHFGVKYGMEYRPPGVGRTEIPWANSHSIYFKALGEFGFIGISILLGIIISNLRRNEKRIRDMSRLGTSSAKIHRPLVVTMQASLIGFAVGGLFLSGLYYPHLYVLAALLESANRICLDANTRAI